MELNWVIFVLLSSPYMHLVDFLYLSRFRKKIFSSYDILFIFFIFRICNVFFCAFLQVLDGAGLDIDFHLASPEGRTLVFEQRKSDGVHT